MEMRQQSLSPYAERLFGMALHGCGEFARFPGEQTVELVATGKKSWRSFLATRRCRFSRSMQLSDHPHHAGQSIPRGIRMEVSFPRHPRSEFPEMLAMNHESLSTAAWKGNWNARQPTLTELYEHSMNERQPLIGGMLLRPPPQAEIPRFPFNSPEPRAAEAAGVGERVDLAERPQSRVAIKNCGNGRIIGHAGYSSGMAIRRRMTNRLFSPCAIVMLSDSSAGVFLWSIRDARQ
jgi:hypothetical protein